MKHSSRKLSTDAYLPLSQLTHGELESWSSSYVPTAQFVHDVCPAAEYVPAAQASHAVDESLSKSYSPAAHGVHAVDPAAAYCPTPHAVHGVLGPSVSAKPAAHCVHVAAPAAAYSPSLHAAHDVNGEVEVSPAAQFTQAVDALSALPESSSYCPATQSVHAVPVVNWPAKHTPHEIAPLDENVPAAHATHCVSALKARCTTQFVPELVPASVKSVENVTSAPLTAETVKSELSGTAVHVTEVEASTSRKTSPVEMPVAVLLRVIVSVVMVIESNATW